ncbi:MAG: serine hydrolase [Bacteroidota bacterium]
MTTNTFIRPVLFILLLAPLFMGCDKDPGPWNHHKLEAAMQYAREIGTHSLIIQTDGEMVKTYGEIDSISRIHSIRKAILMALISQHLDKIDLNSTLADLGIDDTPIPLTDLQKTATVEHLIKSISGINHPAVSQVGNAQRMRDSLLGSSPNTPGTKWAYNNWDYNALTTVFEQESSRTVQEAFEKGIARPLHIEKYETFYRRDTSLSRHAKVGFRLSTRDMAKFGQLFLDEGQWNGQEIIPKDWIAKITTDFVLSPTPSDERHAQGYLWWLPSGNYAGGLPEGSFLTTGTSGQRIFVIPAWNTVIAHKVMTDVPKKERTPVSGKEFEQLMSMVRDSRN